MISKVRVAKCNARGGAARVWPPSVSNSWRMQRGTEQLLRPRLLRRRLLGNAGDESDFVATTTHNLQFTYERIDKMNVLDLGSDTVPATGWGLERWWWWWWWKWRWVGRLGMAPWPLGVRGGLGNVSGSRRAASCWLTLRVVVEELPESLLSLCCCSSNSQFRFSTLCGLGRSSRDDFPIVLSEVCKIV